MDNTLIGIIIHTLLCDRLYSTVKRLVCCCAMDLCRMKTVDFHEPALQNSIYIAEKEYAKRGDKELKSILVNLLLERSKISSSELFKQVVLDNAIEATGKLVSEHFSILATICFIKNMHSLSVFFSQKQGLFWARY